MKEKIMPKDRKVSALGTNRVFLKIIEAARKEIRAGEVISLEELEQSLKISVQKKSSEPKPRRGADCR